jgi:hypothetical protein
MNWWYIGPRNGHISVFTRTALASAWQRHGFMVGLSTMIATLRVASCRISPSTCKKHLHPAEIRLTSRFRSRDSLAIAQTRITRSHRIARQSLLP